MRNLDTIARDHADEVRRAVSSLPLPALEPRRSARPRALLAIGYGFGVIVVLAIPLIWMSLTSQPDQGPVAPPGAPVSTLPVEPHDMGPNFFGHVIPLDGAPELLGVSEMDFLAAMLPTTPEEMRVHSAWNAMRYNVEQEQLAECMAGGGFEYTPGRLGSPYFIRQLYLPDFETEAIRGLAWPLEWESEASPSPSVVHRESDEWREAFNQCSIRQAAESGVFDIQTGVTGEWWETIASVNISPAMREATGEMLQCVAAAGGPDALTIGALYTATNDVLEGRAPEYEVPASEHPGLFVGCSRDLDETRNAILHAKRVGFLEETRTQVLFAGERYFDSIVARSGFED